MSATYDALANILVTRFSVNSSSITPDATFADLEIDSLFLVEFITVAEHEFDIRIGDDGVNTADTTDRAADIVDELLAQAGSLS